MLLSTKPHKNRLKSGTKDLKNHQLKTEEGSKVTHPHTLASAVMKAARVKSPGKFN